MLFLQRCMVIFRDDRDAAVAEGLSLITMTAGSSSHAVPRLARISWAGWVGRSMLLQHCIDCYHFLIYYQAPKMKPLPIISASTQGS